MDEDKVFFIFKVVDTRTAVYFYIKREMYPSELPEKAAKPGAIWQKISMGFTLTEEEADEFIADKLDREFAVNPRCLQLPLKGTALLYSRDEAT